MRNLAIYDDDLVMKPFLRDCFLEPTSTLILDDGRETLYRWREDFVVGVCQGHSRSTLLPCFVFRFQAYKRSSPVFKSFSLSSSVSPIFLKKNFSLTDERKEWPGDGELGSMTSSINSNLRRGSMHRNEFADWLVRFTSFLFSF